MLGQHRDARQLLRREAGTRCWKCADFVLMTQPTHEQIREISRGTMRYTSGFIMLPRDLRSDYFYGDSIGHDLLIYILSNAHWDDTQPGIYGKGRYVYKVKTGEFISTLGQISEWLGVSRGVLRRTLTKLIRLRLVEEKKLYNCSRFIINSDLVKTIRKPSEKQTKDKCPTNKPGHTLFNMSKDMSCKSAPNEACSDSTQNHDRGTKTKSDIAQSSKNTPPIAGKGSGSVMTPEDLFRLWNQLSGSLPKCRGLSDKRKKQCKLRLKENPDEAYWKTVIENLAKSKFAKEGGWASFDWIIKNYENGDKAFNGNYNDKKKGDIDLSDIPGTPEHWEKHVGKISDKPSENFSINLDDPDWV